MTEWLEALLPQWGPFLLAASAFLSCLMVPLPTSALLITAGALGGTGHLDLPVLVAGAWLGAAVGEALTMAVSGRRSAAHDKPIA